MVFRRLYFRDVGLSNVSADRENKHLGFLSANIIRLAMNAGNSTQEYRQLIFDTFATDTADTKTNFTYDSTNDWYENTGSGLAVLEFDSLLSEDQKAEIDTEREVLIEVITDFAGDVATALILNNSFETAGGGAPDTFANWTEGGSPNWSQATDFPQEGSFNAKVSASTDSSSYTATLDQIVDVTNIKYITVWARASVGGAGQADVNSTLELVGGPSDTIGVSESGTQTDHLIIDVRNFTGNQTIRLTAQKTANGSNSFECQFDNVRYTVMDSDANNTLTVKSAKDGTTYNDTVTVGEAYRFSADITDLGVRIENTKTDGGVPFPNRIKAYGIIWG